MATENLSPAELAAFRRWQQSNPAAKPGVWWLDVAKHGDAQYDLAILLRVLPTGETIRYELKHSGWSQRLVCFVPREGRRPAAGNGGYRNRRRNVAAYDAGPDAAADHDRLDSKYDAEMLKDERNQWEGDTPAAKPKRKRGKAAAAAADMEAA